MFAPGTKPFGGALSFGATLFNPELLVEDLQKQLQEIKDTIRGLLEYRNDNRTGESQTEVGGKDCSSSWGDSSPVQKSSGWHEKDPKGSWGVRQEDDRGGVEDERPDQPNLPHCCRH